MTSESITEWCDAIASLCVDALVTAKLVDPEASQRALEIVGEELLVRISMGDLPPSSDPAKR